MAKSLDSPVKILLADDSVTMHRAVSLALKKESYDLICVDNGKDALRLIHEHRPQIALLDLDMPEKTGIEVAQSIRSDASLNDVQTILLCGSFDEIDEKDIEKAPVDARLWKPFESHVLLAMLRTLINARPTPSAQGQTSSHSSSLESTAPQAARPPLPKSRKSEAIQSASAQLDGLAENAHLSPTQKKRIHESVEATRPLKVEDLFDPTKRPLSPEPSNDDGGDFTRELARETFGSQPLPDELPAPQEALEETAPLQKSSDEAQPKDDPFINNLWSPEELSSFDEETSFGTQATSLTEDSLETHDAFEDEAGSSDETTGTHLEFEILDPHHSHTAELLTSAHQSDREMSWPQPSPAPADTPNDLRQLVAEEVKQVFHSWLRDELQRQLNEVMAELDSEPS
jgi:two-component system, OmpR family, phosphate regulon response regulator PhoB